MSVSYVAVQWTRHKRVYDLLIAAGVVVYLLAFVVAGKLVYRGREALSDEVLVLRALGSCAFLLLHIILGIGPLARLDARFAPLLYNRRHLGVVTFLIGLLHGGLAIGYYHGFGVWNPLVSLLVSNTNYASVSAFPFQIPGVLALLVLFLMAATSHDFWLRNLGAPLWKRLHMLVYAAYALLVAHVAFGALQAQRSPLLPAALGVGVATLAGLHIATGVRESRRDRNGVATQHTHAGANGSTPGASPPDPPWIDAGAVDELTMNRGRAVCVAGGERIAVFRHAGGVSAITNVCAHQGGPLGEGRILDGCITCPWHGWQYRPQNGQSPPPFTERLPTFRVRVVAGRVWIDPTPLPPGTPVEPAPIEGGAP